ncbi:hypothetical protein BTN82_06750 [Pseudomonas chlororaphis]|uniref:Uncharacterized protein n=1 Tax=Pseudomonas chlororaphis TaxID=587753 RepID=A0A1Q8EV20_9PSED|nr:hypothetical protein BTN82_06750 [Pseudomonas chlororaphis]
MMISLMAFFISPLEVIIKLPDFIFPSRVVASSLSGFILACSGIFRLMMKSTLAKHLITTAWHLSLILFLLLMILWFTIGFFSRKRR